MYIVKNCSDPLTPPEIDHFPSCPQPGPEEALGRLGEALGGQFGPSTTIYDQFGPSKVDKYVK